MGGFAYFDQYVRGDGINSATPFVQFYCQEKIPTYTPGGHRVGGINNLDRIPARMIPMRYMLHCDLNSKDNPLARWIKDEKKIMQYAAGPADAPSTWPARMEVRTSLSNMLEATYDIVITLDRAFKTNALRQFNTRPYFRWKGIRAQELAKLPRAVFGHPSSNPGAWSIAHVLFTAQTLIHGLHSRISTTVTAERNIVNMHTLYVLVEGSGEDTTYNFEPRPLTLRERVQSVVHRPFFPAGVRTVLGFSPDHGLMMQELEDELVGISDLAELCARVVFRSLGFRGAGTVEKIKRMIVHIQDNRDTVPAIIPRGGPHDSQARKAGAPRGITIEQDAGYKALLKIVKKTVGLFEAGRLIPRSYEKAMFADYLHHMPLNPVDIVRSFGTTLGLEEHEGNANRLHALNKLRTEEGKPLKLDVDGYAQVDSIVKRPRTTSSEPTPSAKRRLPTYGHRDRLNLGLSLSRSSDKPKAAIHKLDIYWDIRPGSHGQLTLPGFEIPDHLYDIPVPKASAPDDTADDRAYISWFTRAAHRCRTGPADSQTPPSLGDYLVFVLATFQQELLACIPKSVGPTAKIPSHIGDPYFLPMVEDGMKVSQNLLRESYVGLPGRLTRFVATQRLNTPWGTVADRFFPGSVQLCLDHPGWSNLEVTYLGLWRRFLERAETHQFELAHQAKKFVCTFKVLPDYKGKVYVWAKRKKLVPIWDDSPFSEPAFKDSINFDPRWFTIHPDGYQINRIRLAYNFTGPSQVEYLGNWQGTTPIKETGRNLAKHHPSPPPFEMPWMKLNYHRICSERDYAMTKPECGNLRSDRAIGHDWWTGGQHESINCAICDKWNRLNPPVLPPISVKTAQAAERWDAQQSLLALRPDHYNRDRHGWGYFACE
jgi:hypothetical protein